MALFCPQCGAATTPGTAYCGACGATLEAPAAPPLQPVPGAVAAAPVPGYSLPAPPFAQRPTGVTAIAVACFVCAGFAVLGGLAFAFIGSIFGVLFSGLTGGASNVFFGTLMLFFFVVAVAIAGALVAVGLGLNKGREWARVGAIVLAILFGLGQLASATAGLSGLATGRSGSIFVPLLFVAAAIFVVYYLLKPDVRAWFAAQPR